MPANFKNQDNQRKYNELLAKLKGQEGKEPSADEVADLLTQNLNEQGVNVETPIATAKADYFEYLMSAPNGRPSPEQLKRIEDIHTKLNERYVKMKVDADKKLESLTDEARKGTIPGTDWLYFADAKDEHDHLPKIVDNIFITTDPDAVNRLKNLEYSIQVMEMSGMASQCTVKDEAGKDQSILLSTYLNGRTASRGDEMFKANGVTDPDKIKAINKRFTAYEPHGVEGYTFNKDYKPGDAVITKYPEDTEIIKNARSQKQLQDYSDKLDAELRGINEFENAGKNVAKQAKELLDKLDSFVKPEEDGPNSKEFNEMRASLENISKYGVDMQIRKPLYGRNGTIMTAEQRTSKFVTSQLFEQLDNLTNDAKSYEKSHSSLALAKYGRQRQELSKQLQTFVSSAKAKLDPARFEGMNNINSTSLLKDDLDLKRKKLEHFRSKFGYQEFKKHTRTADEVIGKLDRSAAAISEARRNVHLGSGFYDDASDALDNAIRSYKSYTEGCKTGIVTVTKEQLKQSLKTAKEEISAYLNYKQSQGLIKKAFFANKKTQKRIDAMRQSMESIDLAIKDLNAVTASIQDREEVILADYYGQAGAIAHADNIINNEDNNIINDNSINNINNINNKPEPRKEEPVKAAVKQVKRASQYLEERTVAAQTKLLELAAANSGKVPDKAAAKDLYTEIITAHFLRSMRAQGRRVEVSD